MTVVGVIGGGFGLYGYIPAILQNKSYSVITLEKYKYKIHERKELSEAARLIHYGKDVSEIIRNSDLIILARRPNDNLEIVKLIHDKKLIIEKPISSTPHGARIIYKITKSQGNQLYSGFVFKYLNWYKWLKFTKAESIIINWGIKKSNNNDSWKYSEAQGGGLLQFYGIHFLNLAVDLGYRLIDISLHDSDGKLDLHFQSGLKHLNLSIFYTNNPIFQINDQKNNSIINQMSPFGEVPKIGKPDVRVKSIIALVEDIRRGTCKQSLFNTINLWESSLKEAKR